MRRPTAIVLSDRERETLARWERRRKSAGMMTFGAGSLGAGQGGMEVENASIHGHDLARR